MRRCGKDLIISHRGRPSEISVRILPLLLRQFSGGIEFELVLYFQFLVTFRSRINVLYLLSLILRLEGIYLLFVIFDFTEQTRFYLIQVRSHRTDFKSFNFLRLLEAILQSFGLVKQVLWRKIKIHSVYAFKIHATIPHRLLLCQLQHFTFSVV